MCDYLCIFVNRYIKLFDIYMRSLRKIRKTRRHRMTGKRQRTRRRRVTGKRQIIRRRRMTGKRQRTRRRRMTRKRRNTLRGGSEKSLEEIDREKFQLAEFLAKSLVVGDQIFNHSFDEPSQKEAIRDILESDGPVDLDEAREKIEAAFPKLEPISKEDNEKINTIKGIIVKWIDNGFGGLNDSERENKDIQRLWRSEYREQVDACSVSRQAVKPVTACTECKLLFRKIAGRLLEGFNREHREQEEVVDWTSSDDEDQYSPPSSSDEDNPGEL